MTLEEFLDKVCQRPLPQNAMARVKTLAKELAEGAAEGIWGSHLDYVNIVSQGDSEEYESELSALISETSFDVHLLGTFNLLTQYYVVYPDELLPIAKYIVARWESGRCPDFRLLENNK